MVTENYLYRADDRYPENAHIKTICNPRAVEKFTWTAHIPSYRGNYAQISENGTYMVDSHVFYDARYDKLKIHHYYTKSEEEYAQKLRRGWPDQPHQSIMDERIEQELRKRECCNDIRDDCMLYYSKDINRAISKMSEN